MTDTAHTNAIKDHTRAINEQNRQLKDVAKAIRELARVYKETTAPAPVRLDLEQQNAAGLPAEEIPRRTKEQLAAMESTVPVGPICKCLVTEGFVTDPYTQKKQAHITRTYRRECEVHNS